jgi:epoxyqueuosine reductase QueG
MTVEPRAELQSLARSRGAVGFGVCRLADVRTDDAHLPPELLARLGTALSIALPVAPEVLSTIEDRPNQLYEHHYRQVNFALDRLGLELVNRIHALGSQALAIPASQIVDWEKQQAHLSHKRIAVAAGIGWLGRNNLLVTPANGAQVRLLTVLTDLALEPDRPLERGCGSCRACIAACPARAIKGTQAEFDHLACFAALKEFQRQRLVSQYICGVCVRACGPSGCT